MKNSFYCIPVLILAFGFFSSTHAQVRIGIETLAGLSGHRAGQNGLGVAAGGYVDVQVRRFHFGLGIRPWNTSFEYRARIIDYSATQAPEPYSTLIKGRSVQVSVPIYAGISVPISRILLKATANLAPTRTFLNNKKMIGGHIPYWIPSMFNGQYNEQVETYNLAGGVDISVLYPIGKRLSLTGSFRYISMLNKYTTTDHPFSSSWFAPEVTEQPRLYGVGIGMEVRL